MRNVFFLYDHRAVRWWAYPIVQPIEQRGRVPNPDVFDVSAFGAAGLYIVLPALLCVAHLRYELAQLVAVGRRQRSQWQWRAISRKGRVRPAAATATASARPETHRDYG